MGGSKAMEDIENTLRDLGKVPDLLWDALEVGALNVKHFFDQNSPDAVTINSSLAPNLLRYFAKLYIQDNIWRIDGLVIENIPANGLSLKYNYYHARVWKHDGEDLPSPGTSSVKKAFLRQQDCGYRRLVFFADVDNPDIISEEKPSKNLVFLWEADQEYNLLNLRLSYPKYCSDNEDGVQAEWSLILDHPISKKHLPDPSNPSDTMDKNQAPVYDLLLDDKIKEELIDEEDEVGE
jgi:hypothetical protein